MTEKNNDSARYSTTELEIADRYQGEQPLMFLDIDHTLTHSNGGAIDPKALELVQTCVRQCDARIVLCSDRVREADRCIADLYHAGLTRGWLVGHCSVDPYIEGNLPSLVGRSTKVLRIAEWLEKADSIGKTPPSWCVVDDARTLALHWMTAPAHVKPSGPVITDLDMALAWTIMLRKLPHDVKRGIEYTRREAERDALATEELSE
jgi:hypothetical protein